MDTSILEIGEQRIGGYMTHASFGRAERFAHELQKVLADIIQRHLDTSSIGLATITSVSVSKDFSIAHVRISVLNRTKAPQDIEAFFGENRKYLRGLVGRAITSRTVPDLAFHYDPSFEEMEKLDRLFGRIHDKGETQ